MRLGNRLPVVRVSDFPKVYLFLAAGLTLLLSLFLFNVARGTPTTTWNPLFDPSAAAATAGGRAVGNGLDSILNETLGFQKIFVINLPSRSDHRDQASLAASLIGLKLDYIDGVTEFDKEHALPVRPEDLAFQGPKGGGFAPKTYKSWRAHVNAIRTIVEQNLTSALIMEDDADYDIRIKSQLVDFARASRLLLQPIADPTSPDNHLDPTNPRKGPEDRITEIEVSSPPSQVIEPTTSPYGDTSRWDILWLGHCGTHIPSPRAPNHPLGRAILRHDSTAIQPQHYGPMYGDQGIWASYPNNTRLITHALTPVCNFAYAVSQQAARRLLYEVGIRNMTGTTDTILHYICDGTSLAGITYKKRVCLSVLPSLFSMHQPQAYPRAVTENIKMGARANFAELVDDGQRQRETEYYDAYPDGEPMALHFFGDFEPKGRYERYLREPEKMRKEVEERRRVGKEVARLRKLALETGENIQDQSLGSGDQAVG